MRRVTIPTTVAELFHFNFPFSSFSVCWFVVILILLQPRCLVSTEPATVSVATYNLWNVMFNWEVRLMHIADMIRQNDLDIVVFQEVRMAKCEDGSAAALKRCPSQLDEFRWLLPEYRWVLAQPAGSTTRIKSSISVEWQAEGLGILSRLPIVSSNMVRLRQTSLRDSNQRIALHVKVKSVHGERSDDNTVDILVVHFSYDSQQQCDNANDIVKFIEDAGLNHPIILGDFNVYGEMNSAVGQFVGLPSGHASCPYSVGADGSAVISKFQDIWLSHGKGHQQGLSFSNMPTPGLQSRPDRILISKQMHVIEAGLIGNESVYWNRYHLAATYHRAQTVFLASHKSFIGLHGYSCLFDCGPHGSCRCGVCVGGGNGNNCHLPNCPECNSFKFVVFVSSASIAIVILFIFILSVIRILVVSARFNQNDIMDILGYRCCLFNKQLFKFNFRVVPRRFRLRLMNIFRLCDLPLLSLPWHHSYCCV